MYMCQRNIDVGFEFGFGLMIFEKFVPIDFCKNEKLSVSAI